MPVPKRASRADKAPLAAEGHGHSSTIARGVFYPSLLVILALCTVALAWPEPFHRAVDVLSGTLVNATGWYYVLAVALFVAFVCVVAVSRKGDIVLGKDEDEPEHSLASWFAMLFAAGMGIGLVFFGAAEPLSHYASPHPGAAGGVSGLARDAMATTFLHWGLSAWAIYAVVGLGVAYAIHRKGLPVSIRWSLVSVLGDRAKGGLGTAIDVVAVVGTLVGVATSLGFGVMQLAAGVQYVTGISLPRGAVVAIAVIVSSLAAISVSSGLDRGIKLLSNANLVLCAVFMVVVFLLGPTLFILNEFVQDIGYYLQNIIILSLRTMPFEGAAGMDWMSSWTINYWGWWISWSPFVGIFIARISRGRTVREFIMGVVLVPTLVTFLWFAVLGGTTLYQQIFGGFDLLGAGGLVNSSTALFQMLATLPASRLLSAVASILLVVFFVTSSDSGSYVMAMMSSGGDTNPPTWLRLVWAAFTGAVATILLASGGGDEGLSALQTLVVASALPMSAVILLMCASLWHDLSHETELLVRRENRLMRSRLVEEAVQTVSEQIDDTMRSTGANVPIAVRSPLWTLPRFPAPARERAARPDVARKKEPGGARDEDARPTA